MIGIVEGWAVSITKVIVEEHSLGTRSTETAAGAGGTGSIAHLTFSLGHAGIRTSWT